MVLCTSLHLFNTYIITISYCVCLIVIHRIRASGVDAGSAATYVRTLNDNNIHNATKLKIKFNKSTKPAALLTGYGIDEDDIECLMGALSISVAKGGAPVPANSTSSSAVGGGDVGPSPSSSTGQANRSTIHDDG